MDCSSVSLLRVQARARVRGDEHPRQVGASGYVVSLSTRYRADERSDQVNADPAAFLELFLRERGDWPAISALQTRARWVLRPFSFFPYLTEEPSLTLRVLARRTPARSQSKRFDASFFCAILPAHDAGAAFAQEAGRATTTTTTMGSEEQGEGHQATSDGVETVEAAWLSPAELVERAARDPEAMRLLPPQLYLLAELANAPQLDALLDLSDLDARGMPRVRARKVVKLLPELKVVDDLGGERRRAVVLPGDCEHGETQSSSSWPAREDRRRRLHRVFVKITDGSMMAAQGVVRHNVDDVLGHGWQNMQAGDVGELKSHL